MLHQQISIAADQISPNANRLQIRNALANQISHVANDLAQRLDMSSRVNMEVLVCCLEKVMNTEQSAATQTPLLTPVNGRWEFDIYADKMALPATSGQHAVGSLETVQIRLSREVSYLKSFEQGADTLGIHRSEQLEGLAGNWPGKVSFGQRIVKKGNLHERETGRFVDNPATRVYGLEEGRRHINNRMIESGRFRPSPVSGSTQLKQGIRQILANGQTQIGTFDMLPGNYRSYLAQGTIQTNQDTQYGQFGLHAHSGRHHLQRGTIVNSTGAAAQGYFDISANGHLILTAGQQIRQDGSQRSGFYFAHNPLPATDDTFALPRFCGPFQERHSPAA